MTVTTYAGVHPSEAMTLAERIDVMADAAFPAAHRATVGGWTLRADPGRHRRNRSVWAREGGANHVAERIDLAEAWYAMHGLPARFQVTPASRPAGLDGLLAARGYTIEGASAVWTGDLAWLTGDGVAPVTIAERADAR